MQFMKDKPKIVSIMGPTGVGKTDLAISLSETIPSEIISVDSVQIYKHLNIGSGKPSSKVLTKYPHKLIDILELRQSYSMALFRRDAMEEIIEATANKKIPLLVGGTMLYFRSIVEGISHMPSASTKIREKIYDDAGKKGWDFLHKKLSLIDPKSANKIHKHDSQRIQRALEVYELTLKPMSIWQNKKRLNKSGLALDYEILQFAIKPESREIHRQQVERRFLSMLDNGLIGEVKNLLELKGINSDLKALKNVGYKQVCQYLEGHLSYDEMINRAVIATRQLAKRQMTFLRGWKDIIWLPYDKESALSLIANKLENKTLKT